MDYYMLLSLPSRCAVYVSCTLPVLLAIIFTVASED